MTDPAARDGVVAPFFSDPDFDFEFRDALGATTYGVGDVGLWLTTAARIVDGDHASWFTAWSDRVRQLADLADASVADLATASWAHLAASAAWSRAMGAIDGLPADQAQAALLPTFRESRRCWEAMIDASSGRHVRLDIPYEGTTLPGWLLRPDATGTPRPTLVFPRPPLRRRRPLRPVRLGPHLPAPRRRRPHPHPPADHGAGRRAVLARPVRRARRPPRDTP